MSRLTKGQLSVLKKTVAVLTTLTTVLSLAGVAALPSRALAAVPGDFGLQEGNTISASGTSDPDIYIVNAQGYKRLFLNPVIFNFYGHLGGFPAVKAVSATTRDAFPTSGLFRNCETNDEKVYGVEVNAEDTGVLHWVNTSGAQAVIDDPNFFKKVFCINNNEFNWYPKGSNYTSVSQVPNYSRTGVTPTGPLSASLASDNPASTTLVEGQALADLAHFQVNGSGTVTSVELKRLGVSGDTALEDIFLFVNGVRVSDSGNVSSGIVTFNNASGLFNAPAVVVVKADIKDTGVSGQTVGIQATKFNTSTVSVSGNIHTIATAPTLATVAVGTPTGPGNFDPQNDVSVWTSTFTISNEDVFFRRMAIREIGSVDNADVRNLRLLVDGVQIATATGLNSEGYATFNMNHRMLTGARTIKVVADVVGGATRTLQFSLRGSYDLEIMDEAYNVGVEATAAGVFPEEPAASTIGSATITASKATNSPSGDIVDEATDVALARFDLKAFGEAVKIETLYLYASSANGGAISGLSNGRVLINGTQYGSTATLNVAASTSYTVNYTIPAGATAVVEVRADLKEASAGTDVGSGDIISVILDGDATANNAQGVSSATTVDVPGSNVESNNMTVVAGAMVLGKQTSYSDQVVTLPQSGYKLGSWVLTGSSAEAINLTTLSIDVETVDGTSFDQQDITNMYLKYGSSQTSAKSTVAANDNDYSISRSLGVNEVLVIEAWGDLGSTVTTNDAVRVELSVSGTTASSGTSVSQNDVDGQKIDTAAGTFTTSVDAGTGKLALSNSTVGAGTWRFRGDNENFTISELRFQIASGSNQELAVASLVLKDGGAVVATQPLTLLSGDNDFGATFAGLNIPTGLNGEKLLTVDVSTADVNSNVATGKNVAVTLDYAKNRNSQGVEATDDNDRAGANIYVHDGIPSLAKTGSSVGTNLTPGVQPFAEFSVTPTGNVGAKRVRFDITKSSALGFASNSFKIYENNVDISSVASISQGAGDGPGETSFAVVVEFNSERTLSGATTYRLEGNLATFAQSTNLTATINVDAATATPVAYGSVSAASTFVWTDRSAGSHSESTTDWMNSFLVPSLPISWSKSVGA